MYLNELETALIETCVKDKCTGEKIIPAIEVWHNGNLLPNSGSPSSILNTQPFFVGTTIVKWIFTNKANNTVVCSKTITVIDTISPIIDCSTIDPKILTPIANSGECYIEFEKLKINEYYANDNCSGFVKGILTQDGSLPVSSDYRFEVGKTYNFKWLFSDTNGNTTVCDQTIKPTHSNEIDFECSTLQLFEKIAKEEFCELRSEERRAGKEW